MGGRESLFVVVEGFGAEQEVPPGEGILAIDIGEVIEVSGGGGEIPGGDQQAGEIEACFAMVWRKFKTFFVMLAGGLGLAGLFESIGKVEESSGLVLGEQGLTGPG